MTPQGYGEPPHGRTAPHNRPHGRTAPPRVVRPPLPPHNRPHGWFFRILGVSPAPSLERKFSQLEMARGGGTPVRRSELVFGAELSTGEHLFCGNPYETGWDRVGMEVNTMAPDDDYDPYEGEGDTSEDVRWFWEDEWGFDSPSDQTEDD